MKTDAHLSDCRTYRYWLSREWDACLPKLVVIGLNPSTADETRDDPTIRRCIGFAKREGFGGLMMLNLFAFRATDPKELKTASDPVGPLNDETLQRECWGQTVLAAWGSNEMADSRADWVKAWIAQPHDCEQEIVCLGKTKYGHPKHPLYIKREQPFVPLLSARQPGEGVGE